MAARLREKYNKEIKQALQKELNLDNSMAVPRLEKIVLNMGLGEATQNTKLLDPLVNDLTQIAGQKPVTTKAKKSIAAFKVRAGMSIGAMVTLRRDKAYEFLDRLISIALPRVRDFRGVSTKSFDGRGNYTLGMKDQLIFPEIDYAKVEKLKGMNITIVTTAKDDNEARALLRHFGMPFRQGAYGRDQGSGIWDLAPEAWSCELKTENLFLRFYGNDCKESERRAEAEVQLPQAQPVQALRAAARVSAQVRHVPSMLPRPGAQGRDSGRGEVELVAIPVVGDQWSVISFVRIQTDR